VLFQYDGSVKEVYEFKIPISSACMRSHGLKRSESAKSRTWFSISTMRLKMKENVPILWLGDSAFLFLFMHHEAHIFCFSIYCARS